MQGASTVFADAGEEFSSVSAVKQRLEGWRRRYPGTFNSAYMGISSPAIFAPFVRTQLLSWDPVYAPGRGASLPQIPSLAW